MEILNNLNNLAKVVPLILSDIETKTEKEGKASLEDRKLCATGLNLGLVALTIQEVQKVWEDSGRAEAVAIAEELNNLFDN